MNLHRFAGRWWEGVVIALAVNSAIFGVLFTSNGYAGWALAVGFAPASLLSAGLIARRTWRSGATIMIIAGSLLAAVAWWVMYTVALALVIIVGGFATGRIGPRPVEAAAGA